MFDYKNPFIEYNANVLSSEQISVLFAKPFDIFKIEPSEVTYGKSAIIFEGGRGTGKTMLLRQFSYNVQKLTIQYGTTFLKKVKNDKYLGVYFRVDNALLKSLEEFYINNNDSVAISIFTHYFELTIFKEYLEIIKIFLADTDFKQGSQQYLDVIGELSNMIPSYQKSYSKNIDDLINYVIGEINYIWDYQSRKAIDIDNTVRFEPKCGMVIYGHLTNEFCKSSVFERLGLNDISILLLIDEFENFSESQQKVINTAMRFSKDYGARLRIGMRPSGFKSFDTLDAKDFIKEGRDYRKVQIMPFNDSSKYYELIKEIAAKRLSRVSAFGKKNIIDFLGEREDLEDEAKKIVENGTKHIEYYLKKINKTRNIELKLESLSHLRDDNPLYEMENLLLLLRGKTLEYVTTAFEDYKKGVESEEAQKYKNDYNNKYKLSFLFILCSIYKIKKKGYYGFIDYCHLSSGIIGCFIELCRRAFEMAQFRDYDALLNGKISSEIQTDAAYEYAHTERDMIKRIAKYGGKLQKFIDNIGNAFFAIHKDVNIKYPETNQFPVKNVNAENEELLKQAQMWSLIIKKPNAQDITGKNIKQDVYILNRIFAPVYKISCRTRGGFSPVMVTDEYFTNDFDPQKVLFDKKKHHDKDDTQLSFLDNCELSLTKENNNTDNSN